MAKMDWTAIMDLAGAALGGTDYVRQRMQQLEFESEQADKEERKKLEKRDREISAMRELAALFEPAGEERLTTGPARVRESETIPVMEDASGGLVSDPSQPSQPIAMNTGLGQGYDQALGLYTQGMDPASANMVRGGALGIAGQRAVGEREEFERGTQRLIERERTVDTALEPERLDREINRRRELGEVDLELDLERWDAMQPREREEWLFRADYSQAQDMAKIAAQRNIDEGRVSRATQESVENYARGVTASIINAVRGGADPDRTIVDKARNIRDTMRAVYGVDVPWENIWGAVSFEARMGGVYNKVEEEDGEDTPSHSKAPIGR